MEEAVASYQASMTVDVAQYLWDRGIEEQAALTARLGVVEEAAPGHERFRGWLAIPYLDRNGLPLTIRFRCLAGHHCSDYGHGKYQSITGDLTRVYNIGAIHRAGDVINVTEGELDAIILNQLGLDAVAIPGARAFQGRHRRMLAGFSRVNVWADPDDAGAEFVNKVCRMLRSAKGVRLRDGDVTETFLRSGRDPQAIFDLIGEEA